MPDPDRPMHTRPPSALRSTSLSLRRAIAAATALVAMGAAALTAGPATDPPSTTATVEADTALVVAVDVSDSVDAARYQLQIDGIAAALEDPAIIDVILSGGTGAILVSVVTWADAPEIAIPWRRLASAADAALLARDVRAIAQKRGEYTCLTRMLRVLGESVVPEARARAHRVVVDVSGDGIDNCMVEEASDAERNSLVAAGVTINGLPILVPGENDTVGSGAYRAPGFGLRELPRGPDTATTTLDAWYRDHVIGGPAAFIHVARGYEDFARAFRHKFVTEISSAAAADSLPVRR